MIGLIALGVAALAVLLVGYMAGLADSRGADEVFSRVRELLRRSAP